MAPLKGKSTTALYEEIAHEIKAGRFAPVYILMGEESFYIDRLTDLLVDTLIPEEQRDFDLSTFFGADTQIEQVIMAAREFPMMATRKVVILREAQALVSSGGKNNAKEQLDRLELYLRQPQPNTVLVVCYKDGVLDRRSKMMAQAAKLGVVFNAEKLDNKGLATFVRNYVTSKKGKIEADAAVTLVDFVGNDLSRLASEADKLLLAKGTIAPSITHELVVRNIGVSKEYNIFELQDALVRKDVLKANRIIQFFDSNAKEYPPMRYLPVLFKFFSNILIAHYSPDKTPDGLATWMGMSAGQIRYGIIPAMQAFSPMKTLNIIALIRRTDARTKGVGNPSISDGDLIRELIYFILH